MTAYAIILAAGQGTRMKSKLYKVLHQVCGKSMVEHVLSQVKQLDPDQIVTIIGHGADKVKATLAGQTEFALQKEQLGTGHAVLQAEKILGQKQGVTLVVCGDTPLLKAATFKQLMAYHQKQQAAATILTASAPDPTGYGRIIRDRTGAVAKIVEQKDATVQEAAVQEVNTGVYCFDNQALFQALHQITNQNAQHEYYLTDVIEIFKQAKQTVAAYQMADFSESMGVNDRVALAQATALMRQRINRHLMENGVTLIDPSTTYIDADVQVGADTVIEPGVVLRGQTIIGRDCLIGAHSQISDSLLADRVTVTASYLEGAQMESGSDIGPYSHLRPQAKIGPAVHIGNFVEIKKAQIGKGTKVGHLTYVGDATLGQHINVGCGCVFVNYDGINKHHTNVGDYSFIGSASNLIAPLEIADHAYVAAGSTVTDDVAAHDMAIARGRQVNKKGYYDRYPVAQAAKQAAANEKSKNK
ncbi:bifunctional UDP-N-acetylglucosamine diphosphorylase/glucosamine-1-phosphate N-acetyltransferase GlmU [Liquorilactobacillus vini]|uniref:Bifunctional protein GlmU n=1 Tax=Liquorilactobacillus vini DSM 20605 TaxID=1133569 RepID=A0A0R2C6J0_9LACO|nr:bifunctional UDP-N-acetylglucosamine diphosphorylase/glucosamine-1-phosphate N-acetyltransferase GlmU [Liquorilactobacillus vini]KRM87310.1 bifunctional N-acetylglucosamine-1-phosphate uridyltransferase glucosamine-1-phosphate acetyltransferase [Liquorilactobacillus vini DSM 20605]